MKHEIDLKNFIVRTDLAVDKLDNNIDYKSIIKSKKTYKGIEVKLVQLNSEDAKRINKKEGLYVTITFEDTTDSENQKNIKNVFKREFKKFINIKKDDLVLVVGLGNSSSTPDALGPKIVDKVIATNHLYDLNICSKNYQKVATFIPSVTGKTGIETFKQIKSITDFLKPKIIIVIDALASSSIERVNKTIQITNTGISPGSGIGNQRMEISYNTLNIPVIAIGVPTVVDAVSIVSDTINYMHKNYSFSKYNAKQPKYLLTTNNVNYLKEKIIVKEKDKKTFLGLVGALSDVELKKLISEVLTPIGYNLMVTPKEVDFIVENFVNIIGIGLNEFFEK